MSRFGPVTDEAAARTASGMFGLSGLRSGFGLTLDCAGREEGPHLRHPLWILPGPGSASAPT